MQISITFTAQKLLKCNMRGDTSKQCRHQVAIFREDERRVANQPIQGNIERGDMPAADGVGVRGDEGRAACVGSSAGRRSRKTSDRRGMAVSPTFVCDRQSVAASGAVAPEYRSQGGRRAVLSPLLAATGGIVRTACGAGAEIDRGRTASREPQTSPSECSRLLPSRRRVPA